MSSRRPASIILKVANNNNNQVNNNDGNQINNNDGNQVYNNDGNQVYNNDGNQITNGNQLLMVIKLLKAISMRMKTIIRENQKLVRIM